MFLALDPGGKRFSPVPKARGACPVCKERVLAKCGKIVTWHWAHERGTDCDAWSEMSEWHLKWQEQFPERQREWVIGEHRADVLTVLGIRSGTWTARHGLATGAPLVIELQHSSLSTDEISERELYYGRHVGQMIWIWDCRDSWNSGRLTVPARSGVSASWDSFTWKHFRETLSSCTFPVFLDADLDVLLYVRSWPEKEWMWDLSGHELATGRWGWGSGLCTPVSKKPFLRSLQLAQGK